MGNDVLGRLSVSRNSFFGFLVFSAVMVVFSDFIFYLLYWVGVVVLAVPLY